MTDRQKTALEKLDEIVHVQSLPGNWNYDAYMHGMANGLILAAAILHDREPVYLETPEKWLADIEPPSGEFSARSSDRRSSADREPDG
jgi:hypothetical protein